jgi:hypothetical protein
MTLGPCALESATAGQPNLKGLCHLSVRKGRDCGFSALSQLTRSGLSAVNVLPIMHFVAPDFCTEKHQCFQLGDFRAKFLIFAHPAHAAGATSTALRRGLRFRAKGRLFYHSLIEFSETQKIRSLFLSQNARNGSMRKP